MQGACDDSDSESMKDSLRFKLGQLASRVTELNHLLAAEGATRAMDRYRALSKEHA